MDLHEVVTKSMDSVLVAVQAKHLKMKFDVTSRVRVYGDAIRLQQVFGNLLSNAIKFTPSGGAIFVTLDEADKSARVRVRDTGVGIDPKDFSRLFKHFSQVDRCA